MGPSLKLKSTEWLSLYDSGGYVMKTKKQLNTRKQKKTISPAKPLAPANKYLS